MEKKENSLIIFEWENKINLNVKWRNYCDLATLCMFDPHYARSVAMTFTFRLFLAVCRLANNKKTIRDQRTQSDYGERQMSLTFIKLRIDSFPFDIFHSYIAQMDDTSHKIHHSYYADLYVIGITDFGLTFFHSFNSLHLRWAWRWRQRRSGHCNYSWSWEPVIYQHEFISDTQRLCPIWTWNWDVSLLTFGINWLSVE